MPDSVQELVWWGVSIGVPFLLVSLKGLLYLGFKQLVKILEGMREDINGLRDDLNVEREEREDLAMRVARIEVRCEERHKREGSFKPLKVEGV